MAVTQSVYTGNGSLKIFTITFPYVSREDVKVLVNNTPTTAFVFLNDNQIELATAPAAGAPVVLVRQTDVDDPAVEYYTGSPIRATDINLSYAQSLYSLQEWRDQSVLLYYGSIPYNSVPGINFDTLVQATQPVGTSWRIGKGWLKNDGSNEFYIWDGTTWLKTCCGEGGGGGGGGIDPLTLGPIRWYKANDPLTVQISSSTVSGWLDKSGNGAHLTQSNLAERPIYSAGELNGQSAINWGNVTNNKSLRNASNITAREVWIVCRADFVGATFPDFLGLFNPGLSSGAGGEPMLTASVLSTGFNATRNYSLYANGNHSVDVKTDVIPEIQSACLLRQVFNANESTIGGISVGLDRDYNTIGRGWRGVIGEILVFPDVLSPTDANTLAASLKNQWGII